MPFYGQVPGASGSPRKRVEPVAETKREKWEYDCEKAGGHWRACEAPDCGSFCTNRTDTILRGQAVERIGQPLILCTDHEQKFREDPVFRKQMLMFLQNGARDYK